jgi:hypothetical protein
MMAQRQRFRIPQESLVESQTQDTASDEHRPPALLNHTESAETGKPFDERIA